MKSINQVTLTGRLGQDPVIRKTNSGVDVMELRIAVSDRVKQGEEWVDRVHWFNCTMFGHSVSFWGRTLAKGSFVALQGKLEYRTWEKDGEKRHEVYVFIDTIDPGPRTGASPKREEPSRDYVSDTDEIPF